MRSKNFKTSVLLILTVMLTLGLSISIQTLLASWTPPSTDPPGNNITQPINTGASLQAKSGPFWIESNSNIPAVEASLKILNTGSINSFMVQDESSDATPFVINSNGNVGIGKADPQSKLDIGGNIMSDGINVKDTFIERYLSDPLNYPDLSPTCTVDETELPPSVQANGRCSCDVSEDTIDCSVENLVNTDYPGCFDRYKYALAGSYANYEDVRCHDLTAEGVIYFEAWEIKEDNKMINSPFVSRDNCHQIYPSPGAELGEIINDALKKTSCVRIVLKDGVNYFWEKTISVKDNESVYINTKDGTNGANGGQATITMQDKHTYTYNGITWRSPGRAIVGGYLQIGYVFIDEKINDSRGVTHQSEFSSIFTIGSTGRLSFSQSEISATENIINFYGNNQGGTCYVGHLWVYRKPSSPRSNLYVTRAYDGWNFSGNNGVMGWPDSGVHLNTLKDGTTGTGVQKYPPTLSERARILYPDDVAAAASDKRYKKNIENLDKSLDKILQLNGVRFDWKDEQYMNGKTSIGLIAQDTEKIIPEVVFTDTDGFKSIDYGKLVAPLIEAIKEQQAQINDLKNEVKLLK